MLNKGIEDTFEVSITNSINIKWLIKSILQGPGSPTYAVFTTADPTTAIFGKLYVIKADTFCMVKSEQFKTKLRFAFM